MRDTVRDTVDDTEHLRTQAIAVKSREKNPSKLRFQFIETLKPVEDSHETTEATRISMSQNVRASQKNNEPLLHSSSAHKPQLMSVEAYQLAVNAQMLHEQSPTPTSSLSMRALTESSHCMGSRGRCSATADVSLRWVFASMVALFLLTLGGVALVLF